MVLLYSQVDLFEHIRDVSTGLSTVFVYLSKYVALCEHLVTDRFQILQ